jgi:ABC-type sugar transport system permease subunit/ABC-type glycerol-3-phosphate transport system substrate-binding protein
VQPGLASPTVLEVWEFPRIASKEHPHDRYSWIRTLLASYQKEHPEVTVRLTELTWKAGGEKLRIALFAGQPPDLVSGAMDPRMIGSNLVEPIDPYLTPEDRQDYLPGALEAFQSGGNTYAWPWCRTGDFLFLNLRAFQEADVEPPKDGVFTRESFAATCAAFALRRASHNQRPFPLGIALSPGKTAELGLLLTRKLPLLDEAGRLAFQGPAAQASLERLRDWKQKGWLPPSSPGWNPKDLWLALTRDQSVAMAPFGLWAVRGLEKQAKFPFTLAALPPAAQPASEVGMCLRPAATVGYMVLRRPDRTPMQTRAAQDLARYLSGRQGQAYLDQYGQFPTRRSVGEIYQNRPAMQRASRLLALSSPLPVHPAWGSVEEAFKRRVQSYLLEGESAQTTLDILNQQISALLNKAETRSQSPLWFRLLVLGLGILFCGSFLWLGRNMGRQGLAPLLLAAPALAALGLFLLIPAVQGFLLAFREVHAGSGLFEGWVGLENFRRALQDEGFRVGCRNTLLYAGVVVPGNLLAGLVLAGLIHPLAGKLRAVFRGAFYLPGVASVVAMAIVWRQLLDEQVGVLNRFLAGDGGLGWLVRSLLPCLERVPLALIVLLLGALGSTAWMLRPGGEREPTRRRLQRDQFLLGMGALTLGWVLLAFTPGYGAGAPIAWLTSKKLSFYSVLLMVLVRGPGGGLLVYLAALEAVDPALYQAAEVDGANALQRFYHVTLPFLAPTTFFLAVTGVIDSFQAFGPIFLLTDGGPGFSSTVVVHRMFLSAFRDLDFGLAAAQGAMLFVAVACVGIVQSWGRR